jgi:hypothetical protein
VAVVLAKTPKESIAELIEESDIAAASPVSLDAVIRCMITKHLLLFVCMFNDSDIANRVPI